MAIQSYHFNPFTNQNYPSFFQNSPVMKSFRLPHTRPFLPHFAEAKKTISRGAKSAPKIGLYFTLRNGPIFGKLLTWKIFFLRSFISQSLMCFLFSHYSCKLLKIEGRKKVKYVVVGRINERYG